MSEQNELGQPISFVVENWEGARPAEQSVIVGARCRLEPIDADRHAADLHAAYAADESGHNWTYLPYGPFASEADYHACVSGFEKMGHTHFYAIVMQGSDKAVGVASYLRIEPPTGLIEVGHLCYSPSLQRTPVSTETMYLMMKRVFEDWGYRRYEWKCDSLNAPSRAAAARLGFRYEGTFRQQTLAKGRNRDTAWYSITDIEWPGLRAGFEAWLDSGNFDDAGRQLQPLSKFMPESAGRALVIDA